MARPARLRSLVATLVLSIASQARRLSDGPMPSGGEVLGVLPGDQVKERVFPL